MTARLLRSEWWEYDLGVFAGRLDYSRPDLALAMIEAGKRDGTLPLAKFPRCRIGADDHPKAVP